MKSSEIMLRATLPMILLSMILLGCVPTQRTASLKAEPIGGVPYVCSEAWMKDQGYASDGKPGQIIGEDTEQTNREIRRRNASLRSFCKRKLN